MNTGTLAIVAGCVIGAAGIGASALRGSAQGADPGALRALEAEQRAALDGQRALEDRLAAASRRADQLALGLDQAYRTIGDLRAEQDELRNLVDDLLGFGNPRGKPEAAPATGAATDTSVAALDPFGQRGVEAYARSPEALAASASSVDPEREREILAVMARAKQEEERREREREDERRKQRSRQTVEGLTDRLGLAPDQIDAMALALYERDVARNDLMRGGRDGDPSAMDQRRAEMAARDQAYEARLQEVLTPTQYEGLKAIRQEWAGGGQRGEDGGPRRMRAVPGTPPAPQ